MSIRLVDNGALTFHPGSIPDYQGPIIPGSKIFHSVTDSFKMIIQELKTDFYTLHCNWFKFDRPAAFESSSELFGLFTRVVLKNQINHSIQGEGKINLREEEVLSLWAEQPLCVTTFEGNKEYLTFDVYSSPKLLEQLNVFFPELKEIDTKAITSIITRRPCFITPSMKDVIRQIAQCPYDASTRQFYFDIKVREFLYVLLEDVYHKSEETHKFSNSEISKLVEAREKLLTNLSYTYTIAELSKAVGINSFKLKVGFRQLFGVGVFECLQDRRMEKARDLIVNSDKPLKEICSITGYPRMTNFITAFRKKFGYTPGSLRR